jgi:hypothetical protein
MTVATHDDEQGLTPPSPQDWGLPEKPTLAQRECWENQQRFLRRYAERGKKSLSAADVGLHPTTIERWQSLDLYGFNKRLDYAYQAYREYLEEEDEEYLRESAHNTQIYRIFRLKAAWPEKYREDVKIVGMEPVREMLDKLTEIAAKRLERERRELEQSSLEGEYREMGEEGQQ